MKNKLLAVALCACMTGALLGCGGQPAASSGESTETGNTGAGNAEASVEPSGESSAEPSEEPSAEKPAVEPVIREGDYTGIKTAANGAIWLKYP